MVSALFGEVGSKINAKGSTPVYYSKRKVLVWRESYVFVIVRQQTFIELILC